MLQLVMGNLRSRMQECIHREGGHLKGIIFRKLITLIIDNKWQTFAISIAIVLLYYDYLQKSYTVLKISRLFASPCSLVFEIILIVAAPNITLSHCM
ncbi:hypothetical protein C0J52_05976 [Blattella germanica]|nr:hypothetical protein C0J52_05976 [Blattella germanica]